MNRAELKKWAKEKIKGHVWELFLPVLVADILTNLTVGQKIVYEDGVPTGVSGGVSLGIFFAFVAVGLAFYMVKFINDQDHKFTDLFAFVNDYVRIFVTYLLEVLFVFLFMLLLIIPGFIKAFAYKMVPYLLADSKYNNLKYKELLDLSEKMMFGHKMDLLILHLSFIGWYLLILVTCGLAVVYVAPLIQTAETKFLYDIKTQYEVANQPQVKQ